MRIRFLLFGLFLFSLLVFLPTQVPVSGFLEDEDFQNFNDDLEAVSQNLVNYSEENRVQNQTREVAVLFLEFPDEEEIADSKIEEIRNETFHKVEDYFWEASYETLNFEFSLKDIKEADRASDHYKEDLKTLVEDAVDIFDYQVDFSGYDHVMVIHNGDWNRATASLGEHRLDTDDGEFWMGLSQLPDFMWRPRVFPPPEAVTAHELYHNFGALPDLYISPNELGPWDPMAEGGIVHTISYLKTDEWLDWLPSSNIESVNPGTFENFVIHPLEYGLDSGLQVLKIPTPEDHFYFVEVRRNTSISDGLPEEGVLVTRIEEKEEVIDVWLEGQRTEVPDFVVNVMDAEPDSGTLDDAAYQVRDQLRVDEDDFQLEVLSEEGDAYRVRTTLAADTPKLEIQSPVSELPVVLDGEVYEADENGVFSRNVWPGWRDVGLPSVLDIDNRRVWVFRGWGDGELENERSLEVRSDLELFADYEEWRNVNIRFVDVFGSPVSNKIIEGVIEGENLTIETDDEGFGKVMVPQGKQEVTLNYFGQEMKIGLEEDEYDLEHEISYTPYTTFLTAAAVLVFLLLSFFGINRFAKPKCEAD